MPRQREFRATTGAHRCRPLREAQQQYRHERGLSTSQVTHRSVLQHDIRGVLHQDIDYKYRNLKYKYPCPLYIYILCINVFVICNNPVEESIHTRRRGEVHFELLGVWPLLAARP